MNINIQINDKELTSITTSSTASAGDSQNSGPSKAAGATPGDASDVLDIGAPPSWLNEAMQKDAATPVTVESETGTGEKGESGGSAPSF